MLRNNAVTIGEQRTELFSSPMDRETTVHKVHIYNPDSQSDEVTVEIYLSDRGEYFPFRSVGLDEGEEMTFPRSINLEPGDKLMASCDRGSLVGFISAYVDEESGSMNHFNPQGKWRETHTYDFLDVVELDGKAYVVSNYEGTEAGSNPREAASGLGEDSSWERLIAGVSWQGPWSNGEVYNYFDLVSYGNDAYICLEDGVEGVRPAQDDRWYRVMSRVTWQGEYNPNQSYKAYDMVSYEGESWIATAEAAVQDYPGSSTTWQVMTSAPKKVDDLEELVNSFDDRINENESDINHLRDQSVALALIF